MHNAKGLAANIHARLGSELARLCFSSFIPDSFLAGLISVENAQLNPGAYRFELGVYNKLKAVRNPIVFWHPQWSGITHADLKGASDEALVNLATSFGLSQIMGWHCIHNLKNEDGTPITIAQLRDPNLHLGYTLQLLQLVAGRYLRVFDYASTLRIWNTGNPKGAPKLRSARNPHGTYDREYVPHALAVMQAYRQLKLVPPQSNDAHSTQAAPGTEPAPSP